MLDFAKADWVTYMPAYGGNRDSETPMTVEIHPLSFGETAKYTDAVHVKQRARGHMETNTSKVTRRQIVENVRNPLNVIGISGKPVETSTQLHDDTPTDLVKEILNAIEDISTLTEGEVKNSD